MKKTLTVNLGGTVFHIDEDAFQLLDKYLTNLRIHFSKEEGSDEIMNDFELRISEILCERVRLGNEVITIEHVEGVIMKMGKVEELFDEAPTGSTGQKANEPPTNKTKGKKRLFRNPDDRMLGGVASGLAAYLDCDPTPVRLLLFAAMFLLCGTMIPLYIILWLVIPMASTAEEKLQMRGEHVTIETIGQTVTNGFEKVTNNVNDYVRSGKPRSLIQKMADLFVSLLGIFLKLILILVAVVLFPPLLIVLFVLIVVIFAVLFGGGLGLLYAIIPSADWTLISAYPQTLWVLGTLAVIVLIGIPVVSAVYAVCSQLFKFKPVSAGMKWTLLILWFVALLASGFFAVRYGVPLWGDWTNAGLHYSA